MAEERMSAKQYAKFEKVFFLYGSISKMVQPVRPDEWQKIAEEMWTWAIVKVAALVDEYTNGFLEPPPDEVEPPAAEVPAHRDNGRGNTLTKKRITVKAVTPVKTGERNGTTWTLTRIVDTENVRYTTFAGHRYEVGKAYAIEWEESQNGQYVNRSIKEPKERQPDEDEDIPF
jgi:hypothetical protein